MIPSLSLFFPAKKGMFSSPEVGRQRPPRKIGSQQGRKYIDFVSEAQQVKYQIPGLGKVVRELEALEADQDAAAEEAFAATTAVVVAGNVSQVHKTDKTDPFDGFSLLFFLCFLGFFGGWCTCGKGRRGGIFDMIVY